MAIAQMSGQYDLDIFGQHQKNIYTQICLCYSMPDSRPAARSTIIETLATGLERLSSSFPWVAGQVSRRSDGIFVIEPLERTPRLVVNDQCSDRMSDPSNRMSLTWNNLGDAGLPARMLHENDIAPINTFPEDDLPDIPVLVLQASFIPAGVILCFAAQHQVMDATGQGHIMHLLAKACDPNCAEPFTADELKQANRSRRDVVPLLSESELDSILAETQIGSNKDDQHTARRVRPLRPLPNIQPSLDWTYFTFSASSLARLKNLATGTIPTGTFISTNDALSAYLWQCITRARRSRLEAAGRVALTRTVDVRSHLGISPLYPGLAVKKTYSSASLETVLCEPLGKLAAKLRLALSDPDNLTVNPGYQAQLSASLLSSPSKRAQDKLASLSPPKLDPTKDVNLSSWAKLKTYDLEFGLGLGRPETVRRPAFEPKMEGVVYLMPKRPDGGVEVMACLREEDLEALGGDQEFNSYAVIIG